MTKKGTSWVLERAREEEAEEGCTPAQLLRTLADEVKQDVAAMNRLSDKRRRGFKHCLLESKDIDKRLRSFVVQRQEKGGSMFSDEKSTFALEGNGIRITPHNASPFLLVPHWDRSNACCRYCLDGAVVTLQDVSRRALEHLLFNDPPSPPAHVASHTS